MSYYLKDKGIKNNEFFLVLYDPDLAGVDPRDPRLNSYMKQKVLRECMINYWYFIREVIRIPDQGGQVGSGARYKLHRGNLAMNFGFMLNWNMFVEFPRQHFKTVSALCRFLWEFNFGTSNSEMMFINKKHDDSKLNLSRLKELRDALPSYLQMSENTDSNGKKIKASNTVETLQHILNNNKIKTLASARNKVAANSLGRGCTQPRQWYDEYAFIPYNGIVYSSATPAFKTASMNAQRNNAPYGILITTTPGDLTTDEGMDAFLTKENATPFNELFYDFSLQQLEELKASNTNSSFFYMRFTYQQLGSGEDYFKQMVIDLKKDWPTIRREVLLEWAKVSDNSPFRKEDLNIVKNFIREPIRTVMLCGYYQFNIYKELNLRFPPLVGVDVAGGYQKDSSTITVVDSQTTEVAADMNCNYISTPDLARVLYELVTKYMNNAVVNIERNGGYGASVLSKLVTTSIKRNLFYEIKDRVIEERTNGMNTVRKTQKVKVYGLDSTKDTRELLIQILRDRMEYHKDKFISPIIFSELETLEVKKNGRIEHSSNGHDDQIFSYLLALYIWYEGKDLMERYGIQKQSIRSDEDASEAVFGIEEKYDNIITEIESSENDTIKQQLDILNSCKSISYEEWLQSQTKIDQQSMDKLLSTPLGKKAYAETYNIDEAEIQSNGLYQIPDTVFTDFYNDNGINDIIEKNFNKKIR
jgi:hypothetical protein